MSLTAEEREYLLNQVPEPNPVERSGLITPQGGGLTTPVSAPQQAVPAPDLGSGISWQESLTNQADTIGGLVGSVLGSYLMRGTPAGRVASAGLQVGRMIAGSGIGAGVGAGVGSLVGDQVNRIRGKDVPIVPSLANAAVTGITNAALDVAGNFVFNLGGKAFNIAKEKLALVLGRVPRSVDEATVAAQKILETEGGSLTKYQVDPSGTNAITEGISRSLPGGRGVFINLEKANTKSLQTARDSVLETVSKDAYDAFKAGGNLREVVKESNSKLTEFYQPLYKELDQLSNGVYVNFSSIRKDAIEQLKSAAQFSRSGKPDSILTSEIASELKALEDLKDAIPFEVAMKLRSKYLSLARDASAPGSRNTVVAALYNRTAASLKEVMEESAKKFDPKIYEKYRTISSSYEDSIKNLYPKTLKNIFATNDAAKIGEGIFSSGNVETIMDLKRSLAEVAKLDKDFAKSGLHQKIVKDLERGYAESLFGRAGEELTPQDLVTMSNSLRTNQSLRQTFEAAFSPEVKTNIKGLLHAAELSRKLPGNSLSLFAAGEQIGAARALAPFIVGGAVGGSAAYFSDNPALGVALATGVVLTPRILAKMATNKEAVRHLIDAERWMKKTGPMTVAGGKIAQGAYGAESMTDKENLNYHQRALDFLKKAYSAAGITEEDVRPGLTEEEKQYLLNSNER